eukprot:694686-Pelagomonas_calceolata.AAC.1
MRKLDFKNQKALHNKIHDQMEPSFGFKRSCPKKPPGPKLKLQSPAGDLRLPPSATCLAMPGLLRPESASCQAMTGTLRPES